MFFSLAIFLLNYSLYKMLKVLSKMLSMVKVWERLSYLLTILRTDYFSEQNSIEKKMETVVKGPISTDNLARGKINLQLGGEAH